MYYPEWVMFFDEFAKDLHPAFKAELSLQIFEKGAAGTGIKGFEKYGFQLIVGMNDMEIKVVNNKAFAKIDFITPTSWSFPVNIYWTVDNKEDVALVHTTDIIGKQLQFFWADNFPIDKILPHIRPYRRDKKGKNGFDFDIEYYYYLLPDITIEFHFSRSLSEIEINALNALFSKFVCDRNKVAKGKEIEYLGTLEPIGDKEYQLVLDLGLKNTVRIVSELLADFVQGFDYSTLQKVVVR